MSIVMKHFACICGLIAAFLCLAQNANAQYAGPIQRKGANLVTSQGNPIPDQELVKIVGEDIYNQTVVGARKQLKAGKGLIWGGVGGVVLGLAGSVVTGLELGKSQYNDLQTAIEHDGTIAALYLGSTVVMSLGATAISAGIPLSVIGKKRLNWVADDYNARKNLTYQAGLTPNGVGFALNF